MKKLIYTLAVSMLFLVNICKAQQDVVNGDFEFWDTIPGTNGLEDPVGWVSNNNTIYNCPSGNYITGISKSKDAYSGIYSLKVTPTNTGSYGNRPIISLSQGNCSFLNCFQLPCNGQLVTYRHGKIVGYYKYFPDPFVLDSVYLLSTQPLYDSSGSNIDNLSFTYKWFQPALTWTYFEIPVQYFYGPSYLGVDFSLGISYYSLNLSSTPSSYFLLDSLAIMPELITDIKVEQNLKLLLSPNPVHEKLKMESPTLFNNFALCDLSGRVIHSGPFEKEMDVSFLSKGIYFIRLHGKEQTLVEKFVKE
jgi:hypothetical protein